MKCLTVVPRRDAETVDHDTKCPPAASWRALRLYIRCPRSFLQVSPHCWFALFFTCAYSCRMAADGLSPGADGSGFCGSRHGSSRSRQQRSRDGHGAWADGSGCGGEYRPASGRGVVASGCGDAGIRAGRLSSEDHRRQPERKLRDGVKNLCQDRRLSRILSLSLSLFDPLLARSLRHWAVRMSELRETKST